MFRTKATSVFGALSLVAVAALVVGLLMVEQPWRQAAAIGGCRSAGCTGQDPAGRCDGDAKTVASIGVMTDEGYAGNLDLRWSPSCTANWGRFTLAHGPREGIRQGVGLTVPRHARVTVWNPDEPSQGTVQLGSRTTGTSPYWSRMVDGAKTACTGVEVVYSEVKPDSGGGAVRSAGWFWGPCV